MRKLTIGPDSESVTITDHPNFGDAHRALLKYVVGADYYLQLVHQSAAHTSYQLLRLADPDDPKPSRSPQIAGVATIEELPDIAHADPPSVEALRRNAIADA